MRKICKYLRCSISSKIDTFSSVNLIPMIEEILFNDAYYNGMVLSTKSLGINDSATKFYDEIRRLIGWSKWMMLLKK